VSGHLREVSCGEPAEAELEAVGLSEVVVQSQAHSLAGRRNHPASFKHFFPAVGHVERVFRFDHIPVNVVIKSMTS